MRKGEGEEGFGLSKRFEVRGSRFEVREVRGDERLGVREERGGKGEGVDMGYVGWLVGGGEERRGEERR